MGEEENPYAGRWIARLRGRVVAQGGTPEQARRAALSRFTESHEVVFMPSVSPLTLSPLIESIRAALPDGLAVYLVGGAVRDALLGRSTHDLDFTLKRDAIKLARRIADTLKADFYPLDADRDTGRVLVTNEDGTRTSLDFASFRGADLESDLGGRDFTLNAMAFNLIDNTIHDPLGGAMDLKGKRLRACSQSTFKDDPVRILRGIRLAANFGFHILPETRVLMKEAAGLLGNVSPERLRDELFRILEGQQPAACLRSLDLLGALVKVLPELSALKGVEQISPHVHDVWDHTLSVVSHLESALAILRPDYNPTPLDGDPAEFALIQTIGASQSGRQANDWFNGLLALRIGRFRQQIGDTLSTSSITGRSLRSLLFLAAIYHDIAKPQAKKVDEDGQVRFWGHDQQGAEVASARARLLVLSREEIQRLDTIIQNHMRIHFHTNRLLREGKPPSRRAVYRYFRDTGSAGVDICLLTLADLRATYEQTLPQDTWVACLDVIRIMLEAWFEKREEQVFPLALVDGNDLMNEMSLKPGPLIGKLIEAVREAQAIGTVSTREQALDFVREWLKKNK